MSDFVAQRRVDIDVDGLRAGDPVVAVNTSNQVNGASTQFSSIPILGWIGDRIAMSAAEARRTEAEAIGASRVRDRVLPQFESETATRIEELNDTYRSRIVDRLAQRKAFPEVLNFSSTATHLFALGRTGRYDELAAHEPLLWLPGDSQATIQLHESAINNAMAHGEMAGKKIDENSIARLTGEADAEMPDSETPESESDSVIVIELSDKDPVRVRFDDGLIHINLHAAVIRRDEEKIADRLVTVRYAFEPLQATVRVVRKGDIELHSLSGQADSQSELVSRLRDSLELIFLPEFEVGASPQLADRGGNRVALNLAELKLRDGWLSLSFR